jgi:hypothetical protein
MTRTRFRRKASAPASTAPKSQYSTVGFHLMKVSSCRSSVAPPNSTMIARLAHSIGSTCRPRSLSHATWTKVAAIATPVAT